MRAVPPRPPASRPVPRWGALGALLLLPAAASAQAPAATAPAVPAPAASAPAATTEEARAHDVARGETLWALSSHYYGTAWRWPAIAEANRDRVRDPHWIYPGQRLRIPGMTPEAPEAPAAEPADSAAVEPPAAAAAPKAAWTPMASGTETARLDGLRGAGEWYAAPWVAEAGFERASGELLGAVDVSPSGGRAADDRRPQLLDRVVVRVPGAAASGSRMVAVVRGPRLAGGTVLTPSALLELEGDAGAGRRFARVLRLFGVVEPGQAIVTAAAVPADAPRAASATPSTRVLWVAGDASLPSLGSYVVVGSGARDGVRVGDRYELTTPEPARGDRRALPPTRVAAVRVVRTSAGAATAIVVAHEQPGIAAGARAVPIVR